ncbi:MAG: SUF system NifU family Fe-S cluster assembly protein [Actinomycetota bacterium]|jgi:nitrogen fixation protein NifU and related proteins
MSNLEELYKEIILDHYRTPRNRGELPPPASKTEGFNPLCGDELTVYLEVTDGVVSDIKITGHGCSISQASSSLMSVAVKGKTLAEVSEVLSKFKNMMTLEGEVVDLNDPSNREVLRSLGELAALQGVAKFPVRIKCATLAWNTLSQGLEEN